MTTYKSQNYCALQPRSHSRSCPKAPHHRFRENQSTSDGTFNSAINLGCRTAHSIQIARVTAQYTLGSFVFGLGYSYTHGSCDTANYHQISIGADYNLLKRTDLYLTAAYQHANGHTRDVNTGEIAEAQASIGSYGYNGTNSQTIVNIGLRHRF